MTLTTSSSSSLFSAYLKMPVMFLLTPVDKHTIIKFAYHKGLLQQEKEVEKICDWFITNYLPLRTELIYQCIRLRNAKMLNIPSLYEIQLNGYNRYMSKMHTQPYRLYQQGDYVGVVHFVG